MKVRALLSAAVAAGVIFTASAPTSAQPGKDFKAESLAPQSAHHVAANKSGPTDKVSVIVQLEDAPLASYAGGTQGLRATTPSSTGAAKLDVRAADSQAYLNHLARKQSDFQTDARRAVPSAQVTHRFDVVVNAVAVVVPADAVTTLSKVAGVKAVYPDELLQLTTDRSPEFIDANVEWRDRRGDDADRGEGVIVGVLDTGIWPEHASLSDPDPRGEAYPPPPPPLSGARQCEFTGGANPGPAFTCNNKLIGADRFMATYDAVIGLIPGKEYTTARDDNGHGTHTSTTAAGNFGVKADIFDIDRGTVSGIAPRAHVIMYKVCGDEGCFQSDSIAAIQKAIQDGVNVINFSISGGGTPYADAVEIAFLDAYNAGVFVAASAGNSGPTPETVDHRGPWVTTVAASTHSRQFQSTVTLRASNGDTLQLLGATITKGITAPTPVTLPPAGQELCGANDNVPPAIFPSGTFAGKIVVCQRGGSARVTKGFNLREGGAAGMLLYNPMLQGLATDNHWLPTVHLENDKGAQLLAFLSSHTGVTATFPQGTARNAQGDVMAPFSSRGGPLQSLGVSKPDITAPGMQILAGHTPTPATILGGPPGELFEAIQGTSMSSPHIAGSAALVKDRHPTWTPGQIKSALMTTAKRNVVKEDGTTKTTPFDDGSGRVNLSKAGDPGITFDETGANYVALQNQLWNANYPSVYVPAMAGIITVERRAHSQLERDARWDLVVRERPRDVTITVPDFVDIPQGGEGAFEITIDARDVPVGQTRHALLELSFGDHQLQIPITIVRRQSVLPFSKTCSPATFALNESTTCTISATNTSFLPAPIVITDQVPDRLVVTSVSGGATRAGNLVTFSGTLAPAAPPNVAVAVTPGASPAGYLPLSGFGIAPIGGFGDETIANFNTPGFAYAGSVYTQLGITSNGYIVVGGGTAADVEFVNTNLPFSEPPNNILAPFWTDLNPGTGGAIRIGTLSTTEPNPANRDTWIVIDFDAVREFSSAAKTVSFQIWIGVNTDAHPGEDITYAFGALTGAANGDGGFLTVGAENLFGNRGGTTYFNGAGTLPVTGQEIKVTGTPGGAGETKTIGFTARGVRRGAWTNYALMTSELFQGASVAVFGGEVTRR